MGRIQAPPPRSSLPYERTRRIVRATAARYGAAPGEVAAGISQTAINSWPRHEARWLLRQIEPSLSLAQIGRLIGNADHTTVRSSFARVAERMAQDSDYAAGLTALLARFEAAEDGEADPTAEITAGQQQNDAVEALWAVLTNRRLSDAEARKLALHILRATEANAHA